MAEKIEEVEYESEISQAYLDYSMSVITERAIPDVRDGLKPVQRRILYALSSLSKSNAPYRKSARVVGDTMGRYHPHGDSSIYEGLVNMAQDWKLPIPLVDPHGNFGALDGSNQASMRYTEARQSEFMEETCIKYLPYYKDFFIPNFDNTETEPTFLPFHIPNVLVSGSKGIAVGMATNIPTHNLGEVLDTVIYYLNNPNASLDDLLKIMKGPDFATGGICNTTYENIRSIYESGRGKLKLRGKIEIKDLPFGRKSICVTEIPFTMVGGTEGFLNTVAELVRNHDLPSSVCDIADRSGGKEGLVSLCIDVKKGTTEDEIRNTIIPILYKKAKLEDTYGVNINCIHNNKPEVMGLIPILDAYIEFEEFLYQEQYQKMLSAEEKTREVKEGLIRAIDCIDLIIEILRGSTNVGVAKDCLMHGITSGIKFRHKKSEENARELFSKDGFSEVQCDAILGMRLMRLINLEVNILKKELSECKKLITEYTRLLKNPDLMKAKMCEDILEIKRKFAIPRRTEICDCGEIKIEKPQDVGMDITILLDRFNYVKVIDKTTFEKNQAKIDEGYIRSIECSNLDTLGVFDNNNNYYTIKVTDIVKQQAKRNPSDKKKGGSAIGKLSDKGISLYELCGLNNNEEILFIDAISVIKDTSLIFVTKEGYIKQVEGTVFDVSRKKMSYGKDTDQIVSVGLSNEYVVVRSKNGYFYKFLSSDVPFKGKSASGTRLIKLNAKDEVANCDSGTNKSIFSFDNKKIEFGKVRLTGIRASGVKMRI